MELAAAEQALLRPARGARSSGERLPLDVELTGRLELLVRGVDKPSGATMLEARLANASLKYAGTDVASAASLASPVSLRRDPDGSLGLSGPAATDAAGKIVRELLLGLQVLLSPDGRSRWKGSEATEDGAYEVAYHVVDRPDVDGLWRLGKTWYSHERRPTPNEPALPLHRTVVRSSGSVRLRSGGPWFEDLDYTLVLEERARDTAFARYRTTITARRTASKPIWDEPPSGGLRLEGAGRRPEAGGPRGRVGEAQHGLVRWELLGDLRTVLRPGA